MMSNSDFKVGTVYVEKLGERIDSIYVVVELHPDGTHTWFDLSGEPSLGLGESRDDSDNVKKQLYPLFET